MLTLVLYVALLVFGFVIGLLVGRKNPKLVNLTVGEAEKLLADAKAEEQKLFGKKTTAPAPPPSAPPVPPPAS